MNIQIISVKHRETKEAAKIKIDRDAAVDFENDYIHAPDTSLFVGFDYGKIWYNGQKLGYFLDDVF